MANAITDENNAKGMIAALNTDGETIKRLIANPTTHGLSVSNGTTGSDAGPTYALHDDSGVPSLMAASSSDGTTPVPLYADSSGNLLVQST